MSIKNSELILNPDGSVYHLNLKPEHISNTIIFVGDQDRVEKITKHFDSVEFSTQKREFKTQTGYYKKKRISVILRNISRKSKSKNIDPKITKKIWKSMISAFIDYEYRNFKKK